MKLFASIALFGIASAGSVGAFSLNGPYDDWQSEDLGYEGEVLGAVESGVMVLVCAMQNDTGAEAEKLAAKLSKLRIWRKKFPTS